MSLKQKGVEDEEYFILLGVKVKQSLVIDTCPELLILF